MLLPRGPVALFTLALLLLAALPSAPADHPAPGRTFDDSSHDVSLWYFGVHRVAVATASIDLLHGEVLLGPGGEVTGVRFAVRDLAKPGLAAAAFTDGRTRVETWSAWLRVTHDGIPVHVHSAAGRTADPVPGFPEPFANYQFGGGESHPLPVEVTYNVAAGTITWTFPTAPPGTWDTGSFINGYTLLLGCDTIDDCNRPGAVHAADTGQDGGPGHVATVGVPPAGGFPFAAPLPL